MNTVELVEKYADELVKDRRRIHQHPELSNEEFETTKLVRERLEQCGVEIAQIGMKTGVVGILRGGRPGKTIALREDMDALFMDEESGMPFASDAKGKCHACGHDIHTAILLNCVRVLSEIREEIHGNVMFLFQPGEENGTGARELVSCGFHKLLHIDAFAGLHVSPEIDAECIGVKKGPMSASVDVFTIKIRGRGGHGARPEGCIDPVMISAYVLTQIQTIVARECNPVIPAVVTIGSIHGGTAANIIPDEVEMKGTMRSLDPAERKKIKEAIERIVAHCAGTLRGEGKLIWTVAGIPPLVNDGEIIDKVVDAAKKVVGEDHIVHIANPSMGSEDFSVLFPDYGPGVQFRLGTGNNTDPNTRRENHNTRIVYDEDCLATGSKVLIQLVRDFLQ